MYRLRATSSHGPGIPSGCRHALEIWQVVLDGYFVVDENKVGGFSLRSTGRMETTNPVALVRVVMRFMASNMWNVVYGVCCRSTMPLQSRRTPREYSWKIYVSVDAQFLSISYLVFLRGRAWSGTSTAHSRWSYQWSLRSMLPFVVLRDRTSSLRWGPRSKVQIPKSLRSLSYTMRCRNLLLLLPILNAIFPRLSKRTSCAPVPIL
jgi:hypothetical protein